MSPAEHEEYPFGIGGAKTPLSALIMRDEDVLMLSHIKGKLLTPEASLAEVYHLGPTRGFSYPRC